MRILWLTNIPLPEASLIMGEKPSCFGGWLINSSKHLSEQKGYQLTIAFPKRNMNNIQVLHGEKITYYVFPKIDSKNASSIDNNAYLKSILDVIKPDLVHIFGTEYEHTLAMINACNLQVTETVISIQGLVSVVAKHYMSNLPINIQKRFTFRDYIKQNNLIQQQNDFLRKGILEDEAIKRTNNIIGCTTFDKAYSYKLNPKAQYHFCNETLREEFYKHVWSIKKCERHSIFISQASYPIKGLHYVLEAMPLVISNYPDINLYISGHKIVQFNNFVDKLKKSSYFKYIEELIQKYNLENNITFTGQLDEQEMCQRYLKSHVFVCPSSIENSPNSLGEAMILGVPSIASYVGGIPDMLKNKEEGLLYQHDAPYMLAYYICEIFKNDDLAMKLSKNAREHALKTHDKDENTRRLIEIYKKITK